MAEFKYIAKNDTGATVQGTVEAPSMDEATTVLRDRQLIVVHLKEQRAFFNQAALTALLNRVSVKDVAFFARQLSVLVGATIPIVRALKILIRQTNNPYFKTVIASIASDVEGGIKLSQALSKYNTIFNQFFVHMIRAGETTGRLDQVLLYLADQQEKDYLLRSRVRGAMIYPLFILATMIVIGVVLMIFVIPRLSSILTTSGQTLPWPTRILLGTSDFLGHYWIPLLLGVIGAVLAFLAYRRTPTGRYVLDFLKLRSPVLGPIYQRIILTRFAISFSNLLTSGVPVTRSLDIVSDIVSNRVYQNLIRKTITEVENGNSISTVFNKEALVPPIIGQMMSIGEETGKLDSILNKLGAFYNQQVESSLQSLTSLIEPLVIVLLGIGAGIMIVGILLPIYNLTSAIS